MRRAKRFLVFCLFVCLLLGFPIIGSSKKDDGGGGCNATSKYIIGDIHSNQNVSASVQGGNKNFYIDGNVTAVGTVSLGDVNATSTQPGVSRIHVPSIDFAALQNANEEFIEAPTAWGIGATNQIMYIDGDVTIDLTDLTAYQNKTIVTTGNIKVTKVHGQQSAKLNANLIARGSIDIDLHNCNNSNKGITGFIYAGGEGAIFVPGKGYFTGVNIDLHGGGNKIEKSIIGVIMAKNSDIAIDLHGGGHNDKGIEHADVIIDDFIKFITYWREIRG